MSGRMEADELQRLLEGRHPVNGESLGAPLKDRETDAGRVVKAVAGFNAGASNVASALGTLAAGIAHEINNPLCYVIANLQLTARQLPVALRDHESELPTLIDEAIEGAGRIASIVREIQQVSRPAPEEPSIVEVRSVVEAVLRLTSHEIRHRARLETEFAPTAPRRVENAPTSVWRMIVIEVGRRGTAPSPVR